MPGARASVSRSAIDKPIPDTPAPYTTVIGRIPILDLSPQQPDDLWPAKAFDGEVVPFSATVFREGHDLLGADLVLTDPSGRTREFRLASLGPGTDRWGTEIRIDGTGDFTWRIKAWSDDFGTWLHNAEVKVPAGVDVELMFQIGAGLLQRAAGEKRPEADRRVLADGATALLDTSLSSEARMLVAADNRLRGIIDTAPIASLVTTSPTRTLRVERETAGRGAWYEFFPRSEGARKRPDGTWQSGTFRSAARRLPHIAAMGFDVVYIPPIHPIGTTNRKGPNNTLVAGPDDPGSPYGIGSDDGGHDAIHPDLGTEEDLAFFLETLKRTGLELALDIALQASPDHPWVTAHPEFFTRLPDGSIAYAENPPKKYQDIYPLNFDNDPEGIYREMLRVFRHWIDLGVKIFRVDNPHTKPLSFWERLLHDIHAEHPEAIFLSEAFTKPAMMRALAKVGFQQSYTYFTWRNTKEELEEYLTELATETADYLRPNFFVNTHDILTPYLQFGGRAGYKIRAAIAATAVPTWGVYSGYELFEDVARPGSEENIDNEKYEFKPRDWAKAQQLGLSLAPYLTKLNEIRREHPALGQLRNTRIHWSDDPEILVFSKHLAGRFTPTGASDTIIVVANLDPHSVRETTVHLDLAQLGLDPGASFQVRDLVTDAVWTWSTDNYVRLDSFAEPVHILHVTRQVGSEPS
ncbi:alpha-1,4-glucan--maltose-1-phosphate maltosyltransferase [Herbiconiux sp. L3-i23]|uniref:alpha-1,4-glucan--maltose-1-phosphate maltosyltransferase n=1 Tax=Herbiconiux sp. L3-i23 TaxID=2905871 RepID=UPI0020614E77|nr:alpha-1,4-glucan--maltose-1-phosphate maltosyltransferase [Herbiconiux sp. L3-i23]BDI21935.1 alpha-1,4-glucan:maltose-1-phosphate maltosyltransferase 2 [Herbiconiux sp. L3-i23]